MTLTTSTHVAAWPQGDQLLGGGAWHKAKLPAAHCFRANRPTGGSQHKRALGRPHKWPGISLPSSSRCGRASNALHQNSRWPGFDFFHQAPLRCFGGGAEFLQKTLDRITTSPSHPLPGNAGAYFDAPPGWSALLTGSCLTRPLCISHPIPHDER